MPIKAVIFDFGGVLVRTTNEGGRKKWEERLNLAPGELSRTVFESEVSILATVGRVREEDIWKHVSDIYGLSPNELHALEQDFWSGDELDQTLIGYIHSLRPRYKTAILSNAWSGARLTFTNRFAIHDAVDLIVVSAEVGLAKPDPRIYQLIVKRLEVLPEESIFVDDFEQNVIAARTFGIHAIQFINTRQVIHEIDDLLAEDPSVEE